MGARFPLGRLLQTPGVADAVHPNHMAACLRRHARGDWGAVDAEDRAANNHAVTHGARILSVYPLKPDSDPEVDCFWIITDADRSATTALLPSEY